MTHIHFRALSTEIVRRYQDGATDANGQAPERYVSDGSGVPCRHCLADVASGEEYLLLAHRPFGPLQPYAECGPIFLHAGPCERYLESPRLPPVLARWHQAIVRGYSADERIVAGTGTVVPTANIPATAAALLERPDVATVHVRSASNNCFLCRVDRAG